MSLEGLLLWLSCRSQGSWAQFRVAAEEYCIEQDKSEESLDKEAEEHYTSDLPIYQHARFALQRLCHVEFLNTEGEKDWRVVPPSVALSNSVEGGILCGARTTELIERLHEIKDWQIVKEKRPGLPNIIFLRGDLDMVGDRSRKLGLLVQKNAPLAILSAAPSVNNTTYWKHTVIPSTPGWDIKRFSVSRFKWEQCGSSEAESAQIGLFRFIMAHQRFHFLKWQGHTFEVPVQIGKYMLIHTKRKILIYDRAEMKLSIPAICRPPTIIERALILCSGSLPLYDGSSGLLIYRNIGSDVRMLASQLLLQEMQ